MTAQRRAKPPAAPTPEQLRLAWRHFQGRGSCPDTLETTLAHPVWGQCLRRAAQRMARAPATSAAGAAAAAAARLGQGSYVPPTPQAPPRLPVRDTSALGRFPAAGRRPRPGKAFDARRAAANDRED